MLPIIVALFYMEASWGGFAMWLCFFTYVIAAITDFFDGYIARKMNQITPFGTFLDPIIDKVMVGVLLVMLVAFNKIDGLWIILVLLIFTREFLISGFREFLGPRDVQVPVTILAKWKTTSQMVALGFLILSGYSPYAQEFGLLILGFATFLTVITGVSYFMAGAHYLKKDA